MSVVDPRPFLEEIDHEFLDQYQGQTSKMIPKVQYTEPTFPAPAPRTQTAMVRPGKQSLDMPSPYLPHIKSRIVRLGAFIDTDAVSILS